MDLPKTCPLTSVLTLSIFSDIGLTRWFRRGGGAHSVVWLSNKWSPFDAFSTNLQNCEVLRTWHTAQPEYFLLQTVWIHSYLNSDVYAHVSSPLFVLHHAKTLWPRSNVFLKLLITWHNVPPESAQSYHNHLPLALLYFFWGHRWSVQL